MYLLSAIIVFLVGVGIIIAYNSGADPSVMGHDPSEIGPGTFNSEGFSNPGWVFPGYITSNSNNGGAEFRLKRTTASAGQNALTFYTQNIGYQWGIYMPTNSKELIIGNSTWGLVEIKPAGNVTIKKSLNVLGSIEAPKYLGLENSLGLEAYWTGFGECSSYPATAPLCQLGEFKLGEDEELCYGNMYQIKTNCLRIITI